jgi:hypothetical protein
VYLNYNCVNKSRQKERDHQEDHNIGGRIIKWVLDMMEWYRLDGSVSEQGPVECSCEHGNESPDSIKWDIFSGWATD